MKKFTFGTFFLLLLFQTTISFGQNFPYVPMEVRKAYENGTRSKDGIPGPNYWENHANYDIKAQLLADKSMLTGEEKVTYFNNSPDTLRTLVIRLYQDFYKKGSYRAWPVDPKDLTDGVQLSYFKVNGLHAKLNHNSLPGFGSVHFVRLVKPLLPHDSVTIETAWKFHIPEISRNRMGNYGEGKIYVAYWYPQVGVYDDISGWDRVPFNGITEFYNDFNHYKVNITTPQDYAVWATGTLTNARKIFTGRINKRLKKVSSSDEVIPVITQEDWNDNKVLKNKGENTWEFVANYVPDFSFAATLKYDWDASSVLVDSTSGRRVRVDAVYPANTRSFKKAAQMARESVIFMSYQWPGYAFPYEHMTSFSNGGNYGGMETPMMANDGDDEDSLRAAGLIFHENSHTYFPFFMGTNEEKYAWMDEGWATYLTGLFYKQYAPDYAYFSHYTQQFNSISGTENEMPLMIPSNLIYDYPAYRTQAYVRSSLAYRFLSDAMGAKAFKHALLKYMQLWHGKHPIPYDFFNAFESDYGKSLMWYFKPWFFEHAYADQGIEKISRYNQIVIKNIGGLPMPVVVKITYGDGSEQTIRKSTAVWDTQSDEVTLQADFGKVIKKVELGASDIPDVDPSNNVVSR